MATTLSQQKEQTKNNSDIDVADLAKSCAQSTTLSDYPNAVKAIKNILVYDGSVLRNIQTTQTPSY